jgi:flagellar biosynthesis/type III secretory pathway chaperone
MNKDLTRLAEVLEEEIAVGEELCRNLAAQKKALIAWDIVDLLGKIETREPWLRRLGELEERRNGLLLQSDAFTASATLRQAIAQLPIESVDRARLVALRERTRIVFNRLQTDEKDLHDLMGNLMALIQEALSPLLEPMGPTYGERGTAERRRPASALLQSKI